MIFLNSASSEGKERRARVWNILKSSEKTQFLMKHPVEALTELIVITDTRTFRQTDIVIKRPKRGLCIVASSTIGSWKRNFNSLVNYDRPTDRRTDGSLGSFTSNNIHI